MTGTTLHAIAAAGAGWLALRKQVAGDDADPNEDNTFGLPEGTPIARALEGRFAEQLGRVLGTLPSIGSPLPEEIGPVDDDADMGEAMTPLVSAYWDESGKTTRARLGLDPDEWRVTDPHTADAIRGAALAFCEATNATTTKALGRTLAGLRKDLERGIVDEGESIPELRKRVQARFKDMEGWRANMIARTEAARAVHAASEQSALESGVVAGKLWLASGNSCAKCLAEEERTKKAAVALGHAFAHEGSHPAYASVKHPPLHPHCRCTITYQLTDEYERMLAEDGPPHGEIEPGPLGPEPKPREVAPPKPEGPILPDRPIAERLAAYTAGDLKVAKIVELTGQGRREEERLSAERTRLFQELTDLQKRHDALVVKYQGRKMPEAVRLQVEGYRAEFAGIKARREEVKRLQGAAGDESRERLAAALRVDRSMSLSLRDDAARDPAEAAIEPLSEANAKVAREARGFVQGLLAAGDQGAGLQVDVGQIPAGRVQRSYYRPSRNFVALKQAESVSTAVHELGHVIEWTVDEAGTRVLSRSLEFLRYRVGAETPQRLDRLFPDHRYRADELGRKDHFDRAFDGVLPWYIGKDCGSGGSEILSMGLQKLYDDPYGFATRDPEYCKFVLGILDGSLR